MKKNKYLGQFIVTGNDENTIRETNCIYTVWKWSGNYYEMFSGSMYTEGFVLVVFD